MKRPAPKPAADFNHLQRLRTLHSVTTFMEAAKTLVVFTVFKTDVGYYHIPGGFDSHMLPPKTRGTYP